ncbi:hypothetical protein SAMN05216403_10521 [Nitrosospira multiformis ATCC 25196]|uniref:Transmembrane protein n=2 Tax=Nitrosospira multiformis (strain ATCC 25196 / NCIMB 11849 / C 71) TaxID=323848 RepID=A0A1H5TNC9_NITMU|nr:hypothetical protein [Nitrosospira multiformis]SEF64362.1 hypothetical protein SAMN05216403_10521 [Nitrosospira multiformis ATCC 25196]
MDLNSLKTVWLRVRWQMERLGPAGKIGFGLLVFSAVFFLVAVLPRQEESKALRAEAEVLEARIRMEPSAESGSHRRRLRGDQALPAFYAFFPKLDSSPLWIGELVRIAGERGVEISGTEYRMIREKDLKLARYEMMVPVRGNYSQLRGFIADALHAVPAMALVDVAIRREGVHAELLEANIKFNLYLSEGKH